jgi:hypothetical protein
MEVAQNVEGEDGPRGSPSDRKPALSEELLKIAVTVQV